MLKVNEIEIMYMGVILVLKGMSIEVPEGAIISLLGANGAGKTTTLKGISGLLKSEEGEVTRGKIEFDGQRIDHADAADIVRIGICQVLEGRRVLEHLTVEQNLRVGAHVRSHDIAGIKRDLDMVYGYFPKLQNLRHRVSGWLSGGEQQMLVVGRALMARPKLMLLDEPSLGLAPLLVKEIFGILKRLNSAQKVALLLVEQNALAALSLAQYGYVLENGRIVLDGPADRLRDNEDVREFYLGLGETGRRRKYSDVKHYRRRKRWLG